MDMPKDWDFDRIGSVAISIPPVSPDMRCEDVDRIFAGDPDLGSLAVVHQDQPLGLINRYDLIMHLSRDYGRALYAKKPVTVLMDPNALIVPHDLGVDDLESLIADEHPSALLRGFIVTRDGTYSGVASALSLLQLSRLRSERRNWALEQAREKAEAASRSKTRFLANMSHELRTPLNAIIGFAEVISMGLHGPPPSERHREYLGDIRNAGQHLLSLINNILDMARIESGTWTIRPILADPVETAEFCLSQVKLAAAQQGLRLNAKLDQGPDESYFDPQALRHILINLLSNAIKFTPAGGQVELGITPSPAGGFDIWVRDSGIGIAPEKIGLALAPFSQIESDLNRKYDGAGLGLPLVKALAELHGGCLALTSELGKGTTARVHFPAPPAPAGSPTSPAGG